MDKVRVFLSDWQVLFREGIHFTLSGEEDIDVIGETTTNEEALEFIENNTPTIAVLNANHSDFSGISLTRRIRQNAPSVSVVLIMDTEDEEMRFAALKCGASACVTKDIDPDEMINLIRMIIQGSSPISESLLRPEITPRIIEEFEYYSSLNKVADNLLAVLSTNEMNILRSIGEGNTIDRVSAALGINEEAIRHHLDMVLIKLVNNDHNREVIEAAQRNLSPVVSRTRRGKKEPEYVSRDEFEAFKETIRERFKLFVTGLD